MADWRLAAIWLQAILAALIVALILLIPQRAGVHPGGRIREEEEAQEA
jgi:hypothetical protein